MGFEIEWAEAKAGCQHNPDERCNACREAFDAEVEEMDAALKREQEANDSFEPCTFHFAHDPVTLTPIGPACGKPATQTITWVDGRQSPACPEHGLKALDADTLVLVRRVEPRS